MGMRKQSHPKRSSLDKRIQNSFAEKSECEIYDCFSSEENQELLRPDKQHRKSVCLENEASIPAWKTIAINNSGNDFDFDAIYFIASSHPNSLISKHDLERLTASAGNKLFTYIRIKHTDIKNYLKNHFLNSENVFFELVIDSTTNSSEIGLNKSSTTLNSEAPSDYVLFSGKLEAPDKIISALVFLIENHRLSIKLDHEFITESVFTSHTSDSLRSIHPNSLSAVSAVSTSNITASNLSLLLNKPLSKMKAIISLTESSMDDSPEHPEDVSGRHIYSQMAIFVSWLKLISSSHATHTSTQTDRHNQMNSNLNHFIHTKAESHGLSNEGFQKEEEDDDELKNESKSINEMTANCSLPHFQFVKDETNLNLSNRVNTDVKDGFDSDSFDIQELYSIIKPKRDESEKNIDFSNLIPNLLPKLRPYQGRALIWMLKREQCSNLFGHNLNLNSENVNHDEKSVDKKDENYDDNDLHPLWIKFYSIQKKNMIYYNPYIGRFSKEKFLISKVKGGILAEEMGLGKTVEILTLILSNPYKNQNKTKKNGECNSNQDGDEKGKENVEEETEKLGVVGEKGEGAGEGKGKGEGKGEENESGYSKPTFFNKSSLSQIRIPCQRTGQCRSQRRGQGKNLSQIQNLDFHQKVYDCICGSKSENDKKELEKWIQCNSCGLLQHEICVRGNKNGKKKYVMSKNDQNNLKKRKKNGSNEKNGGCMLVDQSEKKEVEVKRHGYSTRNKIMNRNKNENMEEGIRNDKNKRMKKEVKKYNYKNRNKTMNKISNRNRNRNRNRNENMEEKEEEEEEEEEEEGEDDDDEEEEKCSNKNERMTLKMNNSWSEFDHFIKNTPKTKRSCRNVQINHSSFAKLNQISRKMIEKEKIVHVNENAEGIENENKENDSKFSKMYGLKLKNDDMFTCDECLVNLSKVKMNEVCKTTLIVSPPTILHQWKEEILKHISPNSLDVVIYEGVNKGMQYVCKKKQIKLKTNMGNDKKKMKKKNSLSLDEERNAFVDSKNEHAGKDANKDSINDINLLEDNTMECNNDGDDDVENDNDTDDDDDEEEDEDDHTKIERVKMVNADHLSTVDIVLTTYDVLKTDLYHEKAEESSTRSLRYRKRFAVFPSPLTRLKFWRICLDEAQMVEGNGIKAAEMASSRLHAINRWCITGTPFQKSMDDIHGLLRFLQVRPFTNQYWWTHLIKNPYMEGIKTARDRFHTLLKSLMWRQSKSDVADELDIPPQNEIIRYLRFSSIESHFYKSQYDECAVKARFVLGKIRDKNSNYILNHWTSLKEKEKLCPNSEFAAFSESETVKKDMDVEKGETADEKRKGVMLSDEKERRKDVMNDYNKFHDTYDLNHVQEEELHKCICKTEMTNFHSSLLRLRQACFHPQIGKNGVKCTQQGRIMSMDDILSSLLLKAKLEGEEKMRVLVSSLNGLAGIYSIRNCRRDAIFTYKTVIFLIDIYIKDIRCDPLQKLHTFYNLLLLFGVKFDLFSFNSDFCMRGKSMQYGNVLEEKEEEEKEVVTAKVEGNDKEEKGMNMGEMNNGEESMEGKGKDKMEGEGERGDKDLVKIGYSNDKLISECEKIRNKYLSFSFSQLETSKFEFYDVNQKVNDKLKLCKKEKMEDWWLEILSFISQKKDFKFSFIEKLKLFLSDNNSLIQEKYTSSIVFRFRDINGLKLILHNELSEIFKKRKTLLQFLDKIQKIIHKNKIVEVESISNCCVCCQNFGNYKCKHCEADELFKAYESKLFFLTSSLDIKQNNFSNEDKVVMNNEHANNQNFVKNRLSIIQCLNSKHRSSIESPYHRENNDDEDGEDDEEDDYDDNYNDVYMNQVDESFGRGKRYINNQNETNFQVMNAPSETENTLKFISNQTKMFSKENTISFSELSAASKHYLDALELMRKEFFSARSMAENQRNIFQSYDELNMAVKKFTLAKHDNQNNIYNNNQNSYQDSNQNSYENSNQSNDQNSDVACMNQIERAVCVYYHDIPSIFSRLVLEKNLSKKELEEVAGKIKYLKNLGLLRKKSLKKSSPNLNLKLNFSDQPSMDHAHEQFNNSNNNKNNENENDSNKNNNGNNNNDSNRNGGTNYNSNNDGHNSSNDANGKESHVEKNNSDASRNENENKVESGMDDDDDDICVICRDSLNKELSVFPCGHILCFDCTMSILQRSRSTNTYESRNTIVNKKISCPTCRKETVFADVAHADNFKDRLQFVLESKSESEGVSEKLKKNLDKEISSSINGSYSTKLESIIRCICQILKNDENEKVVVFSQWNEVLVFISHALKLNNVEFIHAKSGKSFFRSIEGFRSSIPKANENLNRVNEEEDSFMSLDQENMYKDEKGQGGNEHLNKNSQLLQNSASVDEWLEQESESENEMHERNKMKESERKKKRKRWVRKNGSKKGRVSENRPENETVFKNKSVKNETRLQKCLKNETRLQKCPENEPVLEPARVLLLDLKRGGNGLNLLGAQHVIITEPCLNISLERQAINRVHRIGQTRKTWVHRFIVKDSIDESLFDMGRRKSEKPNAVVSRRNSKSESITVHDVQQLFS